MKKYKTTYNVKMLPPIAAATPLQEAVGATAPLPPPAAPATATVGVAAPATKGGSSDSKGTALDEEQQFRKWQREYREGPDQEVEEYEVHYCLLLFSITNAHFKQVSISNAKRGLSVHQDSRII